MPAPSLFFAPASGAQLLKAESTYLDDGVDYQLLATSDRVAPAGVNGEATFRYLYLPIIHERAVPIRVTPIVDGVALAAQDFTLANPTANARTTRLLKVQLLVKLPPSVTGFATLTGFYPRGTWFQTKVESVFVATAAVMTTALAGTNNDLLYTAQKKGPRGNDLTIAYVQRAAVSIVYVDPGAINQVLAVSVLDRAITVRLATDGAGAITSTAAQVDAAIAAFAAADALVTAVNAPANDGTGIVTAMASTPLVSGTLTTALTGANNDLKFDAKVTLTVASVTGNAITVLLATSVADAITSTAAQVTAALAAASSVAALVVATNAGGNDGTGVVIAMAATPLAGAVGADFLAVDGAVLEYDPATQALPAGSNK